MFTLGTVCSLVAFSSLVNGRLRRLLVRWKLEDACYRRRWRRNHAHCRWHLGHAPGTQTEPQLEAATSMDVILLYVHHC